MIGRAWERYGDLAGGLGFLALAVVQVVTDSALEVTEKVGACAMACAVAAAMWQRRRAPLVLAAAVLVSMLARPLIPPGGDGVAYGIAALVGTYTCAAHLEGWARRAGGALAAGSALYLMVTDVQDFGGVLFFSLLFGVPWVVGGMLKVSRQRQRLLEEQALLLERQRDEQARMAVAGERQRIARELHDVVAHAISVVVLQARGGRRQLDADPAASREAFDAIEATSTQALGEMRRLLGLLRSDDELSLVPQPTLTRVEELAGEMRSSGLPVEIDVEGEPGSLPPGVDVSAYRIVQEALTNALRHAGPARAHVHIAYEEDSVLVEVTDDGGGEVVEAAVPGGGHGLVGIRERVAIVGGELKAGPRAAGGYSVSARLPYTAER